MKKSRRSRSRGVSRGGACLARRMPQSELAPQWPHWVLWPDRLRRRSARGCSPHRSHSEPALLRSCALAAAISWISLTALASPLSQQEIVNLCGDAQDPTHCGRLVEEVQLKRLPNLARRDGDALIVSPLPVGDSYLQGQRRSDRWTFVQPLGLPRLHQRRRPLLDRGRCDDIHTRATNDERAIRSARRSAPVAGQAAHRHPWMCARRNAPTKSQYGASAPESLRKELTWEPGSAVGGRCRDWKDGNTLAIEYNAAGADQGDRRRARAFRPGVEARSRPIDGDRLRTRRRPATDRFAASCCARGVSHPRSSERTNRCCRASVLHSPKLCSISRSLSGAPRPRFWK